MLPDASAGDLVECPLYRDDLVALELLDLGEAFENVVTHRAAADFAAVDDVGVTGRRPPPMSMVTAQATMEIPTMKHASATSSIRAMLPAMNMEPSAHMQIAAAPA